MAAISASACAHFPATPCGSALRTARAQQQSCQASQPPIHSDRSRPHVGGVDAAPVGRRGGHQPADLRLFLASLASAHGRGRECPRALEPPQHFALGCRPTQGKDMANRTWHLGVFAIIAGGALAGEPPASHLAPSASKPDLVEGTVYSYIKDGQRQYSSKPPAGIEARRIKYSFMKTGSDTPAAVAGGVDPIDKTINDRPLKQVCAMLEEARATKLGVEGYSAAAIADELSRRGDPRACNNLEQKLAPASIGKNTPPSIEDVCLRSSSGVKASLSAPEYRVAGLCSFRDTRLEAEIAEHVCVAKVMSEITGSQTSDFLFGSVPVESVLYELERLRETCEPRSLYLQVAEYRLKEASRLHTERRAEERKAREQEQEHAIVEKDRREASREALRRGLESLNQAGINTQKAGQEMMQTYEAPQVQTPVLNQTGIKHCRTIGYITTCN